MIDLELRHALERASLESKYRQSRDWMQAQRTRLRKHITKLDDPLTIIGLAVGAFTGFAIFAPLTPWIGIPMAAATGLCGGAIGKACNEMLLAAAAQRRRVSNLREEMGNTARWILSTIDPRPASVVESDVQHYHTLVAELQNAQTTQAWLQHLPIRPIWRRFREAAAAFKKARDELRAFEAGSRP